MIDWARVDTVLLDMDGTLLDLHFDNHFWLEALPRRLAQVSGRSLEDARTDLFARMRAVEGTIDWYCLDYWRGILGVDLASLKAEIAHLIRFRPEAVEFLSALAGAGKRRVLVTNAHRDALTLKLERTALHEHVEAVISSHDFGYSKEHPAFWKSLRAVEPFEPARTLLLDDSPGCLRAGRNAGIHQTVGIARPDTTGPERAPHEFPTLTDFASVMP